ncbi:MAG: UDP-3-O-[3-hydroxymyristoyl] N-acetylglucosamine deacetylase [Candidatus Nitrohelix vancouverensis]|uniref:UDP-3-O-acyl-N-acetylglucosamine deacetylase n=1 Tax=Candidatus Nitrohelix vancouverensis TaxID=2705534 RepID=A0A7T0C4X2_9BACT|nr:MAG: UDP-3-O-[3-hydroxymyristoyl] N-acetylglucosamine deacetylase [Candidatus Nitrohelix vancouverensis]
MPKERILIVEDETNIAASLKGILSDEGYHVDVTSDGLESLDKIQSDPPDLLILDIWLPSMDGIEVLKSVKTFHPEVEALIISGHGTIDTAVKATKLGAFDFIEKPFSLEHITQSVKAALEHRKRATNKADLLKNIGLPLGFEAMVDVKKNIKRLAGNLKPVLILGEKGTGKEFVAQAIHQQSRKSDLPFVKVNCNVRKMVEVEAQLFHSTRRRSNKKDSEESNKVVLLTNADSLSTGLQERLVQALKREGGSENKEKLLPARVYFSTSKDLVALAEAEKFNQDLLDQLSNNVIKTPPLRDYSENIPSMVQSFFEEYALKTGSTPILIEQEVLDALRKYDWPGNAKELRSILDKIIIAPTSRERITLQDLPSSLRHASQVWNAGMLDNGDEQTGNELEWEKQFIIHHLRNNSWDMAKTGKSLKTTKKQLENKIKKHGIQLPARPSKDTPNQFLQRTLKRSMVLCGSGLHSGIKTGLILQPLPPGSGIIFGDISSGQAIPAHLKNVQSTDYSTCLRKGRASVGTIEHIMACLHMYRITNLLIKIGDEAPVMDGSAKDFCALIEDGEFEEQDAFYEEIVIDKTYTFGPKPGGSACIRMEPCDGFKVTYHMDYPAPIGIQDYTFEFKGHESFKEEIAPARTFGFMEDVAQLTKMGFASGGKLDNFILLGDDKVLNTKLRYPDEFVRHKILDIIGDFYLLGKPIRGHIHAYKSGHTQNIGLMKTYLESKTQDALQAS